MNLLHCLYGLGFSMTLFPVLLIRTLRVTDQTEHANLQQFVRSDFIPLRWEERPVLFTLNKFIYLFIYLFIAPLDLRCCAWAFPSCSEWGLLFFAVASLGCGALALGTRASVVVARGLSSCGSQALERSLSGCGAQA